VRQGRGGTVEEVPKTKTSPARGVVFLQALPPAPGALRGAGGFDVRAGGGGFRDAHGGDLPGVRGGKRVLEREGGRNEKWLTHWMMM
jgi:hypothetical protein